MEKIEVRIGTTYPDGNMTEKARQAAIPIIIEVEPTIPMAIGADSIPAELNLETGKVQVLDIPKF